MLRSVLNRQRHIFVDDDAYSPVSASSFSSGVFATVTTTMGDAEKTTVTAMAIVGIVQRKGPPFAPASWAQFDNCGSDGGGINDDDSHDDDSHDDNDDDKTNHDGDNDDDNDDDDDGNSSSGSSISD